MKSPLQLLCRNRPEDFRLRKPCSATCRSGSYGRSSTCSQSRRSGLSTDYLIPNHYLVFLNELLYGFGYCVTLFLEGTMNLAE